MQVESSGRTTRFVTGVIVGGVVGSLTAMLFAPMSGKRLRRKITTATEDLIEDVNDYVVTGKEKADELLKEGKKKAESILHDAKKLVVS